MLENLDLSKADAVVEPLFFSAIGEDTFEGSLFVLAGAEAKHAVSVKRMTVGEAIAVSDGTGKKIRGSVSKIGKDTLEIIVESVENIEPPKTKLYLVQALAKGDRDELAIQASTELGVYAVIPWQAERSVSIWKAEKKLKGQLRWQSIVSEAAKQSLRALSPKVEPLLNTEELVPRLQDLDLVLVLDPTASASLTEVKIPVQGRIAIVVGPEGGISDNELAGFEKAGFTRVHLGQGILRTSTAGMAVISYLQSSLGDWN